MKGGRWRKGEIVTAAVAVAATTVGERKRNGYESTLSFLFSNFGKHNKGKEAENEKKKK